MEEAKRELYDIPAKTFDDKSFTLRGTRLVNENKQPLILWEGFYQNGLFFDLMKGNGSIAEYLCSNDYDVWIIDSRGNGSSTGRQHSASMDDFAAFDIPAVIFFISEKTKMKPVFIGHSQGGNTALISMMGTCKTPDGRVYLSDEESLKRQSGLKALVTLGSYLDFTFSKPSSLQEFVKNGIGLNLFGKRIKITSSSSLLNMLRIFKRIPIPVPLSLRKAMLNNSSLRTFLFPLTALLNAISTMNTWAFLYYIPNVSKDAQIRIFYDTMEATYWGILAQYQRAVLNEKMMSLDGRINYSENYHKINLPISVVTMEYDTLADPVETKMVMFPKLSSREKFYTMWEKQGHEDFVMNPDYFHQLIDAIKILNL
jgi:pimeloyl-ACP methyl ester carboxylesterase